MNHIMLDIETLATSPDAAITAIGACRFDPVTSQMGSTFHERVDLSASTNIGVIDPATVEWWLQQSEAARKALLEKPRYPLQSVLQNFAQWAGSPGSNVFNTDVRLWSNGPTFDETIVRSACTRLDVAFPIHHRGSRCCRTLLDLACTKGWDWKKLGKNQDKHNALSDAIYQAGGVCLMYKHLGITGGANV